MGGWGVSTLVSSFQPSPHSHEEENTAWLLAPFSSTLPGLAEADSQDRREVHMGHLDATPTLYTRSRFCSLNIRVFMLMDNCYGWTKISLF